MFTYLLGIMFTIAFVFYSKFQLQDNTGGKWHIWGAIMRGLFFISMLFHHQWQDIVLAGAICIALYEVGINVIALKVGPLFVGNTSFLDKSLGMKKWIYIAVLLGIGIFIKLLIK